ncbi:MAG: carboxypeptidase regulatory-like domain-containing protein [Candidatus Edwardsbacteria bacterium]|nr:carboxypeptidase regulatory-like domain-containing protein [Candidatus Edwardsbacteria bacterium]MBU1576371.1 carboxypeptidase regulatory-like domain-containing protein [Candidatus Edwardsbacteria bacterium]MBU2463213.1 carboxypeptidase regulatory-like domain-containing protein [Candidatus Edwardsbacteria bacterium]MBU2593548.1 carboxypeptidase regulatory-like domain-containing protein [Candidatus Edwardsbacteria bacterium]
MKKSLILTIIAAVFLTTTQGLRAEEINKNTLIPVNIYITTHDDVYKFNTLGVNIEELRDGYIEARISQAKIDELTSSGWKVEAREEERVDPKIISAYHDYSWMTAKLDSVCILYPGIARKYSMGLSQLGYTQWAFLITDNPDIDENEAEVRFTATIHGNEPVGTEMCLAMIDSLTQGYTLGTPEITALVDNREIWFVPMYNPDGNTNTSRSLNNGVDPNRNFPVPDGTIGDDLTYTNYIETQNFIDFWSKRRAVLSATYHGGALIANYPWDYLDSSVTPVLNPADLFLLKEVSLGYSRLNLPMYYTPDAPFAPANAADSGVIYGYTWYPVYGSLQDWSYHATSCVDITMEISSNKWPSASSLPAFWSDNREAMLYFIRQAGWGVQGIVTDSLTGLPINWASVVPFGIDKPVYTDTIGDYHRMLMTDQYDLAFTAIGYHEKWASDIRVRIDSVTNLDMQLAPILITGIVSDSDSGSPIPGALVEIVNLRSDTTDGIGAYQMRWNQDDYYSLRASATGYNTIIYDSLKFENDSTINFSLSTDSGVAGRPGVNVFITRLEQPYPNPGRSTTKFHFQLAASGQACLDIYDITGRRVKSLPQGTVPAGVVRPFTWDGSDQSGKKVSAGVYFCRLSALGIERSVRFIMLK